ncbi:uncharacterized protein EI90DRAFT_3155948 [Cantharellus anzutake]|uniref:uncharacterized protein n=1 Tax=Cantharellus anzutake TaxID=1750568 RepID=UPI00190871E7|nr:uncharacterized protein EI90DRAFT_3155948 [Cantharellus anzutake]KAF8328240.1 hypothetical protein EI90DRAFT_3155948 [Cantharellus anzutake]
MNGTTNNPVTPRRQTSLLETGRGSVWNLLAEFPSLIRTEPVKSKPMLSPTVARSQPRRPPPLHPKALFLFNDRSFLPCLDDRSDSAASALPSSALTISTFAATANVRSTWYGRPARDSITAEGEMCPTRHESVIDLYAEPRSHWSSDSDSDSEDDIPLSPTFLGSWNQRSKGPDMTTRPSSPFIDPILSENIRPPAAGRRPGSVLATLSPLSNPWQSRDKSGSRCETRDPLRPIGLQALPKSEQNPDGSWKLIDAHGKTYLIPPLSSPSKPRPSNPPAKGPSAGKRASNPQLPKRNADEDVRVQFRQWQGFTQKSQTAA